DFATTVNIKRQKKKGKIEIEFFSNEDLDRILELLSERES
ncbi:chromosome partitioning protein ParB, partial [Bacillus subtilis]|nr:chromosome partitioning protein ParB [Bacillus subtilis]